MEQQQWQTYLFENDIDDNVYKLIINNMTTCTVVKKSTQGVERDISINKSIIETG